MASAWGTLWTPEACAVAEPLATIPPSVGDGAVVTFGNRTISPPAEIPGFAAPPRDGCASIE